MASSLRIRARSSGRWPLVSVSSTSIPSPCPSPHTACSSTHFHPRLMSHPPSASSFTSSSSSRLQRQRSSSGGRGRQEAPTASISFSTSALRSTASPSLAVSTDGTNSSHDSSSTTTRSSSGQKFSSKYDSQPARRTIDRYLEQRIRKRTRRINELPAWRTSDLTIVSLPVKHLLQTRSRPNSTTIPEYPRLIELYHLQQQHLQAALDNPDHPDSTRVSCTLSAIVDQVASHCRDHPQHFTSEDIKFFLETTQDFSTSRQQFWESMAVIAQYLVNYNYTPKVPKLWDQVVGFALSEVYWRTGHDEFVEQINALTIADRPLLRNTGLHSRPSSSRTSLENHSTMIRSEILTKAMIDALLLSYFSQRALGLFSIAVEKGMSFPKSTLGSLLRIAVSESDVSMLEGIGQILLASEKRYQDTCLSRTNPIQSQESIVDQSRPLLQMTPRMMDSFIYGAYECELYDLARAVFNQGLGAGRKYRASTFTMILNTYSTKDFGFDPLTATQSQMETTIMSSKKNRQSRPESLSSRYLSQGRHEALRSNSAPENHTTLSKEITVADPQEINGYVLSMKQLGVIPTIATLNVLAKLYLEMTECNVPGAPWWTAAFKQYNPLKLTPDVVTNNTLLAYYERQGDLSTMRSIYDKMAGTPPKPIGRTSSTRKQQPWVGNEAVDGLNKGQDDTSISEWIDSEQGQQFELDTHDEFRQGFTSDGQDVTEYDSKLRQDTNENEDSFRQSSFSSLEPLPELPHVRSNRDIYTYNTMLHALLQHAVKTKDIVSIGQCFHDMEMDGVASDTVTFNTNILYHITRGDVKSAMQVFECMQGVKDGLKLNPESKAEAFSSPWTEATHDHDKALDGFASPLTKPRRSLRTFMSQQTGHHQQQEPTNTTQDGEGVAHSPSSSTSYSSSIPETSPASTTGDSTITESDLPQPQPAPDVVTLTSLISGFGRSKEIDRVSQLFRIMTGRLQIEPNLKTYATLVASLHEAGDHQHAQMLWDMVLDDVNRVRTDTTATVATTAMSGKDTSNSKGDNRKEDEDEWQTKEEKLVLDVEAQTRQRRILTHMERKQLGHQLASGTSAVERNR